MTLCPRPKWPAPRWLRFRDDCPGGERPDFLLDTAMLTVLSNYGSVLAIRRWKAPVAMEGIE
jgi:hypothetical protein